MKLNYFTDDLKSKKAHEKSLKIADTIKVLLDRCFPEQLDFITDKCRLKSARCPRRSGKTYACAVLLSYFALKREKANIVYLCLTRGQARENLWPYLKQFNSEFEMGARFHETNLWMTFPNGSRISLAGAETTPEIEKLRGGAHGLDLVVVDECKSFSTRVLKELIWDVLKPALADKLGSLVLIGTPGNVLAGEFYLATPNEPLPGERVKARPWKSRKTWSGPFTWSFHSWNTKHNTAMPHIWEDACADKEARGIPDDDPTWQREQLGLWCPSELLSVYRPREGISFWNAGHEGPFGLPENHNWKYLLGMDLGFHDATALVVAAYADTHPQLFHVYDYKQPHLTVDDIEKAVKETQAKFGEFEAMIADTGGLGKTIIETLNIRGYGFIAAEKREKYDHIELVNTDLASGKIQILSDSYLADEMEMLQWTDETFRKEDKSTPNHACDAFLYLWRHAYNHFWQPASDVPDLNSREYFERWDAEQAEKAVARRKESDQELDTMLSSIFLDNEWVH